MARRITKKKAERIPSIPKELIPKERLGLPQILFFELGRKLMHVIFGSAILAFIYLGYLTPFAMAIIVASSVLISLLSQKYHIPIIYRLLRNFERPEHLRRFPGRGAVFFLIGVLISLVLFPKSTAMAAIAIMTFGDAVASIFNITHGKTPHPFSSSKWKLLEGSIAGSLAGFIVALLFVKWPYAIAGSLLGMAFEALEIKINETAVDDNILVPIAAGAAIELLKLFF